MSSPLRNFAEEADRRARLYAAAPALLRACQSAYDFCEAFRADPHYDVDELMGILAGAINQADQE